MSHVIEWWWSALSLNIAILDMFLWLMVILTDALDSKCHKWQWRMLNRWRGADIVNIGLRTIHANKNMFHYFKSIYGNISSKFKNVIFILNCAILLSANLDYDDINPSLSVHNNSIGNKRISGKVWVYLGWEQLVADGPSVETLSNDK